MAVGSARLPILDGWRALSILFVLAGHLLPIGPKSWGLNEAVAATGMAIFFTLSGFLITSFLLHKQDVPQFLLRRMARIVPVAWLAMLGLALFVRPSAQSLVANLLFVSNLPPQHLMQAGTHLWSLCVEMQFYVAVAILVIVAGKRGLYVLPLACVAVTALRVWAGAEINIVTWFRVDEILSGACVALLYYHNLFSERVDRVPSLLVPLLLLLAAVAAHPASGALNYLRPYLAASAVGLSLYAMPRLLRRLFESRPAAYVAEVSYALYIFHGMFRETWLGTGETLVKYAKRPLLFVVTFAAAHLSTFYFERPITDWARRS